MSNFSLKNKKMSIKTKPFIVMKENSTECTECSVAVILEKENLVKKKVREREGCSFHKNLAVSLFFKWRAILSACYAIANLLSLSLHDLKRQNYTA